MTEKLYECGGLFWVGVLCSQALTVGYFLNGADLLNITWDKHTNWNGVRELDKARNVPSALLSQRNSTAHPSPPQDTPPST
ncbi:hypothetical protein [Nostoc sp. UHCC 0252]|uniref:hypothetical protein n=1 Tax=Nostoc sp. UHCC 0252 TaxID=3110241 RepID=UPI002B215DC3|nr:hypothetical protein [Nostoc sp. UHCC 0252]MEA5605274.1 hypothetical protein [Nostoc sp. UHCC 0252]